MRFKDYLSRQILLTELSLVTKEKKYIGSQMILGSSGSKSKSFMELLSKYNIGSQDPVTFLGFNLSKEPKKYQTEIIKDKDKCFIEFNDQVICIKDDKKTFASRWKSVGGSSGAIFATKDLAPDTMGLGGVVSGKKYIKDFVEKWIKATRYSEAAQQQLIYILNAAYNGTGRSINIEPLDFSEKDLKTISKDFGEILGAFYLTNNHKFDKIEFPTGSNYKFVDLFAMKGNGMISVSVKSGAGSTTPISNISDGIADIDTKHFTPEELKIVRFMQIIDKERLYKGPVLASAVLNGPTHKALSSAVGSGNCDYDSIVKMMSSPDLQTKEQFLTKFKELYKISRPDDESFITLLKARDTDKAGLVLGVVGLALMKELNTPNNLKILNSIVSKITIHQLNVDVYRNSIEFKMKKFKQMNFVFSWGGGTTTYRNVRIGFKGK